ncbi:hypothetical protein HOG21_01725 [bacterium]|nr:hypothetical protein [bacterium]
MQPKKLTPPPTKDGTRTLPLSGEEQKLFYNKLYSLDLDFIVVVAY